MYPPRTAEAYTAWVTRSRRPDACAFLVMLEEGREIAGVVNFSQIVLGNLRGAYLGFYGMAPHVGRGLMMAGLGLALTHAFGKLRLHRVEANVQPANAASLRMVRRLGFRHEGTSARYLKVGGRWRDHERWALLSDGWRR